MRRFFLASCLIMMIFFLSSCELNLNINGNNDSSNDKITNDVVKNVMNDYAKKTTFTINDTTTINGLDKIDSNNLSYEKVTNIDYINKYIYSEIKAIDISKKMYTYEEKIYLENKNEIKPLYNFTELNDAYSFIGISALFSSTNFVIKNNEAVFTISGDEITKYKMLFEQVNLELNQNYTYNPSVMVVKMAIKNNAIDYINFDLSLIFGSYIQSIEKKIMISFDSFETKDNVPDIDNTDFIVKTANTIETFVIEMVYEFGDAIYIKSGDFDMLIDAGQYQDGVNVSKILEEYCTDDVLDVLIATHGHADHLGGFSNGALKTIEHINLIIDYGYSDTNSSGYERERKAFIEKGAIYHSAYECVNYLNDASKSYKFSDDLKIEIIDTTQYLKPNSYIPSGGNENDYSVVCKLTFKENTYLFTGDLSGDQFTEALKKEDVEDITVYKAAHHGAVSYNSNNPTFLNYLNPKICVSSAAIINQNSPTDHSANGEVVYQHPRAGFVRWILNTPTIKNTKAYYFNGTMGTIHITDTGINLPTVEGFGAKRGYNDASGNKITNENNLRFYDTYMYQSYYR